MFISMMSARIPKEWFKKIFGSASASYEALIRSHATFSRYWADRCQTCDNREAIEVVLTALTEPFTAPDCNSVRLMTDEEINNLLLAAKLGLNYAVWTGLVGCTTAGIAHGEGTIEDGFGKEDDE
jgi:hypothetical protein